MKTLLTLVLVVGVSAARADDLDRLQERACDLYAMALYSRDLENLGFPQEARSAKTAAEAMQYGIGEDIDPAAAAASSTAADWKHFEVIQRINALSARLLH